MASKRKQNKPNNEDERMDSDSSSNASDDDSNDEKYTGNEVAIHSPQGDSFCPIHN